MFDDLRNDAAKQYEEEAQAEYQPAAISTTGTRARSGKFLGMTSIQRFVLVFLIMLATCILGFLCLFVTGRIGF
ncbi:MAG: hypothetical protein IPG80_02570 [Anaerolineales bacterium]|jgi:hypothetical protein|uniref:hypothetical protein n=1 Tax=Candidatus Villigracilis vicinus TaxID=3140679 RepID=UPI00313692F1|nr:hypothetical protein [Anaerolineales bacterium]MBK7451156.1 hypothetical protein [Anaerolineales bacterium]MBK9779404.1 hypothetical protein [Anaerolineales bacterium]